MMALRKLLAGLATAAALVSSAAAYAATSPEAALRFIQDIGTRTIKVLGDPARSQTERVDKVHDLLDEGLDLDAIGRFALGRAWQTASPAQRAEYAKLFRDYVLNAYARRLTIYSGETLKVTGAQPIADTDALVLTVIERPNGQPANVGWRVREEGSRYKVVDVIVEGVSMAVTQRQEFASVVANKGFDGLLDALRSQLQQFAAGAGPDSPPAQ